MPGNQDAARRQADEAVKAAEKARERFNHTQYQRGDGALIAEADRNLANARAARSRLG